MSDLPFPPTRSRPGPGSVPARNPCRIPSRVARSPPPLWTQLAWWTGVWEMQVPGAPGASLTPNQPVLCEWGGGFGSSSPTESTGLLTVLVRARQAGGPLSALLPVPASCPKP